MQTSREQALYYTSHLSPRGTGFIVHEKNANTLSIRFADIDRQVDKKTSEQVGRGSRRWLGERLAGTRRDAENHDTDTLMTAAVYRQ